jgi:hypothetical protein
VGLSLAGDGIFRVGGSLFGVSEDGGSWFRGSCFDGAWFGAPPVGESVLAPGICF